MRIHGRTLRPSNLAERRVLKAFGIDYIRVPRSHNPYVIARQVQRLAKGAVPEFRLIREIVEEDRLRVPPHPLPWPGPFPEPFPSTPGSPWCPHAEA